MDATICIVIIIIFMMMIIKDLVSEKVHSKYIIKVYINGYTNITIKSSRVIVILFGKVFLICRENLVKE